MPASVARRIEQAVYGLEEDPRLRGSVKLRGFDNVWRLRVGRHRVIYEVYDDEHIVVILRVTLRSESTYRGL